jgi:SOS-response transcriptional repressor LexA
LGDPFASNLEAFAWLNLQTSKDFERGEREKKEGVPRFGRVNAGEMIEEREERGVKERIFLLLGPRVEVGRHRSDR